MLELATEDDVEGEIEQAKTEYIQPVVKLKRGSVPIATPAIHGTTPRAPPTPDNRIKLPKLTIQLFNGDVTKWTPFWDSYDSAIHRNSSLMEIDKFNYLRSMLKGTAQEALRANDDSCKL